MVLVDSFAVVDETFLKENILQAVLLVGVCPCMDLDTVLTTLISR